PTGLPYADFIEIGNKSFPCTLLKITTKCLWREVCLLGNFIQIDIFVEISFYVFADHLNTHAISGFSEYTSRQRFQLGRNRIQAFQQIKEPNQLIHRLNSSHVKTSYA